MKIAIIGNPGSGKSTLATQLHTITGIPVYHLDQYFWKPGWQRPDRDEFAKIHHALCDKDDDLPADLSSIASANTETVRKGWIIEGMATRHFDYRAEKADVIIFLDIPLWLCLYRIFKRAFTGYGTIRDSSAQGCPERMPDREFLSYVWSFNRKHKPIIQDLLEKHKDQKKTFVITNNKELAELIQKFESKNI